MQAAAVASIPELQTELTVSNASDMDVMYEECLNRRQSSTAMQEW
jgi:hypothetical protein